MFNLIIPEWLFKRYHLFPPNVYLIYGFIRGKYESLQKNKLIISNKELSEFFTLDQRSIQNCLGILKKYNLISTWYMDNIRYISIEPIPKEFKIKVFQHEDEEIEFSFPSDFPL